MDPQNQPSQAEQEQILSAYHERPTPSAVRGIARTYHVSRNTLKKRLTPALVRLKPHGAREKR